MALLPELLETSVSPHFRKEEAAEMIREENPVPGAMTQDDSPLQTALSNRSSSLSGRRKTVVTAFSVVLSLAGLLPITAPAPAYAPLASASLRVPQDSAKPPTPAEPPEPVPVDPTTLSALKDSQKALTEKRYTDALTAADKALTAARSASDAAGIAHALRAKAKALEGQEEFRAASDAWQEAVRAWQQVPTQPMRTGELAGDIPGQIEAFGNAALSLQRISKQGRPIGEAGELQLQIQSLIAAALTLGKSVEKVVALDGRANRYTASNQSPNAITFRPWTVAATLNELGIAAYSRGDLGDAENYFRWVLAIREIISPESLGVATGLNNLGVISYSRGNLVASEGYYKRSLIIREKLAPKSLDVAQTLNNLGIVASDQGNLATAEAYYRRSLEIYEKIGVDLLESATILNNIGTLAHERGDLVSADSFFKKALTIYEKHTPESLDIANILLNLGAIARAIGNLDMAEIYLNKALSLYEKYAPESLSHAGCLANIGNIVSDRGDLINPNTKSSSKRQVETYKKAQVSYERSLEIYEKLAPESLGVARILNNLGTLSHRCGNLAEAEKYFKRSLTIREILAPESLDVVSSLVNLSDIFLARDDPSGALPLLQRSLALVEIHRNLISTTEDRTLFTERNLTPFARLVSVHLKLKQPERAFAAVERGRARSLQEILTERTVAQAQYNFLPADLQREQKRIDEERLNAYRRLEQIGDSNQDPVQKKQQTNDLHFILSKLKEQQRDLTNRIRAADPRYASITYPKPLDIKGSQKALDEGTLALYYFVDEKETYLFAIDSTRLYLYRISVTQVDLTKKVKDLHARIEKNSEARAQATALYDLLIRPAQAQLNQAGIRRLLLCPDGPLNQLPFAALQERFPNTRRGRKHRKAHDRYLVERLPLHYAVSLTTYAQLQTPSKAKQATRWPARIVALGDPVYPKQPEQNAKGGTTAPSTIPQPVPSPLQRFVLMGGKRERLEKTRQQVAELQRLYGKTATITSLLATDANRSRFLSVVQNVDLVHFGCHGLTDNKDPLASALALSESKEDDGLLRAWEVMNKVRLSPNSLVVLGACETGLGKETKSEGILGLTRAFQYAGASSVVVSLWSVEQGATNALLLRFYRNLKAGMDRDVALQKAQIALLRGEGGERKFAYTSPFDWAAFQVTGDWKR